MKQNQATKPASAAPAPAFSQIQSRMNALSQELTRKFSTRIEFKGSEKKGKIQIHYGSREELDRILDTLQNSKV
jgi:hypothetical protein